MQKRLTENNTEVMRRAEQLVSASSNRYRITVQVAQRAKQRRALDNEEFDEVTIKPITRAILEMSDELTQPEILAD